MAWCGVGLFSTTNHGLHSSDLHFRELQKRFFFFFHLLQNNSSDVSWDKIKPGFCKIQSISAILKHVMFWSQLCVNYGTCSGSVFSWKPVTVSILSRHETVISGIVLKIAHETMNYTVVNCNVFVHVNTVSHFILERERHKEHWNGSHGDTQHTDGSRQCGQLRNCLAVLPQSVAHSVSVSKQLISFTLKGYCIYSFIQWNRFFLLNEM